MLPPRVCFRKRGRVYYTGKRKETQEKNSPPVQRGERKDHYFAMAWVSSQPQLISFWWLTA